MQVDQHQLNKLPDAQFSRLEASLVHTNIEQRPMSRAADDVSRHADAADLNVNEFDFNFASADFAYPLHQSQSLPDIFSAVQFHKHLSNPQNFGNQTNIRCFKADHSCKEWLTLDGDSLGNLSTEFGSPSGIHSPPKRTLLAFFIPRTPQTESSFGSRITMQRDSVEQLFDAFGIDPSFIMNMLGRPDYWSPSTKLESSQQNDLISCEFSCQHPRWNLQVQGSPLSVYMRFDRTRNLIIYMVAHKQQDTSIDTLQKLMDLALKSPLSNESQMFLDDPFHLHLMLSMLSFEGSKYHVKRFQRFMWTQINKVDDHLGGLISSDRNELSKLTKDLQVMSQNADSHIANADVAILCASGIQRAHRRLHSAVGSPRVAYERTADAVEYIVSSMEKQKMWFLNYKNRKDSSMNLVYNLVTQQDAANNISIAVDMKRDSASMSAIATLTMIFLPGTFTATVLSAGIFSSAIGSSIHVSNLWWFWIAITIPLTAVVIGSWWLYHKVTMRGLQKSIKAGSGDVEKQVALEKS